MAEFYFFLSGTKIVRTRIVYNVLTLLSEVSGFADVVIVASQFLMTTLYTPYMMKYRLS